MHLDNKKACKTDCINRLGFVSSSQDNILPIVLLIYFSFRISVLKEAWPRATGGPTNSTSFPRKVLHLRLYQGMKNLTSSFKSLTNKPGPRKTMVHLLFLFFKITVCDIFFSLIMLLSWSQVIKYVKEPDSPLSLSPVWSDPNEVNGVTLFLEQCK